MNHHPFDPAPPPSCRSDGSLVVADREKDEKLLAPPGCGATIAYRLGHYNILLPKTAHSEEILNSYLIFVACSVHDFLGAVFLFGGAGSSWNLSGHSAFQEVQKAGTHFQEWQWAP